MKARLEWMFEGLTAPIGFEQPMSVVNLGDVHRTSNVLMDWARGLKVQIWAPNQQAVTLKRLPKWCWLQEADRSAYGHYAC